MDINYLAIVLAALAGFFLGALWYTFIFRKPWQKEIGMPDDIHEKTNEQQGLAKYLVASLILWLAMALGLAWLIGDGDAGSGLTVGLVAGFVVAGLSLGNNYLFEGKSLRLWLINASYSTVAFAAMGLIIGAM